MKSKHFDIIVVGGGHAGTEAALAASRMKAKTLLITQDIETIGQLSCNPAIGGIGKSHLVKEIDALDGAMARVADRSGIQFRVLNLSKGPAVRSTRVQTDRMLYKKEIRQILESQPDLQIFQDSVVDLIIRNCKIQGVRTKAKLEIFSKVVILTAGTFLNGKIYIGDVSFDAGRMGEPPSNALAKQLKELSLNVKRLKTGTPPRIDGKTIHYDVLEKQFGDLPVPVFSFLGDEKEHPKQICCHIAHTNEKTHEIIEKNISKSALFSGVIEGIGPRYCPSIEDKVMKFSEKTSHQFFIEPEGLWTNEVYPSGLSTSLSYNVQEAFIQSIEGFEKAKITRPGYAIEYDFFDPRDLKFSLETKKISGLFFAGQINGTTGYEEAGAQGIIAGINAVCFVREKEPLLVQRNEGYIGVMIDDLITKGTLEPYRMFTSRAEYRLILREDNADLRFTEIGYKLGVVGKARWEKFCRKREMIENEKERLKNLWVLPNTEIAKRIKEEFGQTLSKEYRVYDLLRRPEIKYSKLMKMKELNLGTEKEISDQIEIHAKYSGYIKRQCVEIEKMKKHEGTVIPSSIDYEIIPCLSSEIKEKLERIQPKTLGQASRIEGITPASISMLLVYIKKFKAKLVKHK
jgi:tRNA uridine 5-carboxymethylaminomethyl modification enzyme